MGKHTLKILKVCLAILNIKHEKVKNSMKRLKTNMQISTWLGNLASFYEKVWSK